MIKLMKYLKPFTISIIVIICLLFVQAICNLALPEYMSKIVNNGIQQKGIENSVPDVIMKNEFDKLMLFIADEDKEKIRSFYNFLDKEQLSDLDYEEYLKDYPLLEESSLYELKALKKGEIDEINLILGKAILVSLDISENGFTLLPDKYQALSGLDPFLIISNMSAEEKTIVMEEINKKIDQLPESIITQSSIVYIETEYESIGIDTNKLQENYIITFGLKMIGVALASMIISILVGFLASRLSAGFGRNLREKVFSKVESFSNTEFDKFGTSSLITRTTNDIMQIQTIIVMLIRVVFYAPILGLGGVLKVLSTDISMGWIIAVSVIAISVVIFILFTVTIPKFKIVQKLLDKINLRMRENLTGMLVIRAFNAQKHEEEKFDKVNRDLTETDLFTMRAFSFAFPLMTLIMNIATILIVWVGARQIDSGSIMIGDMMAFIQYTMQIITAFLMISMAFIRLPRASVAANRIVEVLDTKPLIVDSTKSKKFLKNFLGNIKFENVSFKYADADDYIIKNISFEAKPGQTTAIIGSTGSGKSTVVNLIPRFYDVTEGRILIDNRDIRDVTQHDLRDKIGYVPQKGILFSGTVASNLRYGKERASKEEMTYATKISQAVEFVLTNPQKFNYSISQSGNNVSGGQKQRLSIARALIKKPKIYIFDDTFSALDFKTDALLRKALKKETKNSTVLIVAQRINTIMHAEQIIVLDKGEIVGIGSHRELMKKCRIYKEIALSQLSKEELI